ncbi:MAG: succinylglutamate desuccinylase/aspartoacylase family protein, partial [Candidatus Thorarchaeota archaeon]
VTLLPVAGPLAFRLGAKVSPLDSKDLDTVFPGDEHGTVTQRIAWEIWRKVSQADYVIHLKTGVQSCISHTVAMHREYIHVRNLASQLGLPLVVQSLGKRGALTTEAAHEGIAVITIEMRGERESIEPQAAVEVREAILNFMRMKDMIPGDSIDTSSVYTGRTKQVNIDAEGFFIPSVNLGEEIRSGDVLGVVQDKSEVQSPYDGTVVSLSRMNYLFEGDMVASIASPLIEQHIEQDDDQEADAAPRRKW